MSGFGENISSDYTKCKNGRYPATITAAKIVVDDKGLPKLHPESKKQSVKVNFMLDEQTNDGSVEIDRSFNLTFGKNNKTAAYSAWAQVIETFVGIKCGDDAQRHVGEPEMIGKRGIVWTKNVESNGNKYTNIVDFEPIEDEAPPVARAAAAPAPVPVHAGTASKLGIDEDLPLEDDLPF